MTSSSLLALANLPRLSEQYYKKQAPVHYHLLHSLNLILGPHNNLQFHLTTLLRASVSLPPEAQCLSKVAQGIRTCSGICTDIHQHHIPHHAARFTVRMPSFDIRHPCHLQTPPTLRTHVHGKRTHLSLPKKGSSCPFEFFTQYQGQPNAPLSSASLVLSFNACLYSGLLAFSTISRASLSLYRFDST